ncbi:MAG: VWA domain-containing protein [Spirochaetota bacterium]|nr:VWA domain-containing protein [Spirochaetota bacterium]
MRRLSLFYAVAIILALAIPISLQAGKVQMDVSPANPYLLADKKQNTYLKVNLTGFKLKDRKKRTAVNIAIVLDRSGSMEGENLTRAKQAAIMAIERLKENDIVSVITYDDEVSVIVPATKVNNRYAIRSAINNVSSGGSTALYDGVKAGADEVRKYLDKNKVNRIILLSDGQANVGPDSPGALGYLGASLLKEGISVTTIGLGLGYNEDLMVQLAKKSDGNHAFVEYPRDLVKIFNFEFGDVLSVVAQKVKVKIKCAKGMKPIRVLGREAVISGRNVFVELNQLYSEQSKYVLLELQPAVLGHNEQRRMAKAIVTYNNMESKAMDHITGYADVIYTKSKAKVKSSVNRNVMVQVVLQIAAEKNRKALELMDKGKDEEARKLLLSNSRYLKKKGKKYKSKALKKYSAESKKNARRPKSKKAKAKRRKRMKKKQRSIENQQKW